MADHGDPPGLGEIGRNVREIRDALKSLDDKVDHWREELLELRHKTTTNIEAINKLQTQRESDAMKGETRRWMVYLALITAVLGIMADLYFAGPGA